MSVTGTTRLFSPQMISTLVPQPTFPYNTVICIAGDANREPIAHAASTSGGVYSRRDPCPT